MPYSNSVVVGISKFITAVTGTHMNLISEPYKANIVYVVLSSFTCMSIPAIVLYCATCRKIRNVIIAMVTPVVIKSYDK